MIKILLILCPNLNSLVEYKEIKTYINFIKYLNQSKKLFNTKMISL